jgi:hypothetical protein
MLKISFNTAEVKGQIFCLSNYIRHYEKFLHVEKEHCQLNKDADTDFAKPSILLHMQSRQYITILSKALFILHMQNTPYRSMLSQVLYCACRAHSTEPCCTVLNFHTHSSEPSGTKYCSAHAVDTVQTILSQVL